MYSRTYFPKLLWKCACYEFPTMSSGSARPFGLCFLTKQKNEQRLNLLLILPYKREMLCINKYVRPLRYY